MKLKKFLFVLLFLFASIALVGCTGKEGLQGEKGDAGETGPQGLQGVPGEDGQKGDRGEQGEQGAQGNPGDKGDKGETGDKGENGAELQFRINDQGILQQKYANEDESKWTNVLDINTIMKFSKTYTVNLDVNGGTYEALDQQTEFKDLVYLTEINLPSPSIDGGSFAGWEYKGQILNEKWNVLEDVTLVAKYVGEITITLDVNGGTYEDLNQPTVLSQLVLNENVALPTPTIENGLFLGWKKGEETELYNNNVVATESMTLVAQYQLAPAIKNATIAELVADAQGNGKQIFRVTGYVVNWGTKTEANKYGEFTLKDETTGDEILVYGSTALQTAISAYDFTKSEYTFKSPQDFLTNEVTKDIKLGYVLEMDVIRADYGSTKEVKGIITKVTEKELPVVEEPSYNDELYATIDFSNLTQRAKFEDEEQIWEVENLRLVNQKASSSTKITNNTSNQHARLYAGSTVTVTVKEGTTRLVFTNVSGKVLAGTVSGGTLSTNGTIVTITLDENVTSVTITVAAQGRVTKLEAYEKTE